MDTALKILAWYGLSAFVFGVLFGFGGVTFSGTWRDGSPISHPQIVGPIVYGVFWPVILVKWIRSA